MMKSLDLLDEQEKSVIIKMDAEEKTKRRLMDLGISAGSVIQCINKSPYGDPVAYMIKKTVIALRNNDAKKIFVQCGECL